MNAATSVSMAFMPFNGPMTSETLLVSAREQIKEGPHSAVIK